MSKNQVTIIGPNLPLPAYERDVLNVETGRLLELVNGRWGARIPGGVVTFGGCKDNTKNEIAFKPILNNLTLCKLIPGTVEIIYRA